MFRPASADIEHYSPQPSPHHQRWGGRNSTNELQASALRHSDKITDQMGFQEMLRERALFAYGYFEGRLFAMPRSLSAVYALLVSKITSFFALPIPLLSFLALPLYGGSSATVNLIFFYLTWSALVLSHDPLQIEIYGTVAIRLLCFLLPALASLAFDVSVPKWSGKIKAHGKKQLPATLGRRKVVQVALVAISNVLLCVVLQAGFELLATRILHLRSLLRVTTTVPLPWNLLKDLAKGLALRGILQYSIHRFALHTYNSIFKTWHLQWHHSVELPFCLVAAFDHPINYILSEFVPTFGTAVFFRWHVLTWQLFLVLTSLEELFVYSGYAILPSTIVLTNMARRTDAHFASVTADREIGNFGHLGVIDFLLGTTCSGEADVIDDIKEEVDKHQLQQRIEDAVKAALEKQGNQQQPKGRDQTEPDATAGAPDYDDDQKPQSMKGKIDDKGEISAPRRSGRRKGKE